MLSLGNTLSPSQQARIRRMSRPHEPEPSEAGELNIVPFLDILMNVLMFVLATLPVVFTSTLDVAPSGRPSCTGFSREKEALQLSMTLSSGGVSLKTGAFHVGPGCEAGGEGFTVAARPDGTIPWGEIRSCAARLKNASLDYLEERDITITAEPGTPHRTLVQAMDAVRHEGERVLFDRVSFGIPR